MNDADLVELRAALGQFATGVTIVTTASPGGEPIGVTANSFSSVSLDPPMVLWSLAENARSKEAFLSADHFCVHVLAMNQLELSERFARQSKNKFKGVNWSRGLGSVPLLDEYVARFQCKASNYYPVGDHFVIVGHVLQFEKGEGRPLVFHSGQYAHAERRMMAEVARRVESELPISGGRRTTDRNGDDD